MTKKVLTPDNVCDLLPSYDWIISDINYFLRKGITTFSVYSKDRLEVTVFHEPVIREWLSTAGWICDKVLHVTCKGFGTTHIDIVVRPKTNKLLGQPLHPDTPAE